MYMRTHIHTHMYAHVHTQCDLPNDKKLTLQVVHHNPIFQCQHASTSNLSPNLFGVRSLAISLHEVLAGLWQCSLRATRAFAVSSSPCLLYSCIVRRRLFGGNHRYLGEKKGEGEGRGGERGRRRAVAFAANWHARHNECPFQCSPFECKVVLNA